MTIGKLLSENAKESEGKQKQDWPFTDFKRVACGKKVFEVILCHIYTVKRRRQADPRYKIELEKQETSSRALIELPAAL